MRLPEGHLYFTRKSQNELLSLKHLQDLFSELICFILSLLNFYKEYKHTYSSTLDLGGFSNVRNENCDSLKEHYRLKNIVFIALLKTLIYQIQAVQMLFGIMHN